MSQYLASDDHTLNNQSLRATLTDVISANQLLSPAAGNFLSTKLTAPEILWNTLLCTPQKKKMRPISFNAPKIQLGTATEYQQAK